MSRFSPLQPWLERTDPLHSFINIDTKAANQEFGGFLGLDVSVPFYQIDEITAESLESSWRSTDQYVRRSLELITADNPLWLDRDEVNMILSELGDPPLACYPIYLVTIGEGDKEKVVYIGKTSAKIARFGSGHRVATKLHAPKYEGLPKQLYQGCVTLLSDSKDYLPLEWIHPLSSAEAILRSVEAELIYNFQPELNTHHRKTCNATFPIVLHIQNFSGTSHYLHDHFVYPPRTKT